MAEQCQDCSIVSLGLGGRGLQLVIPSVMLPLIAASLAFNRVYWRLHMLGCLGWDDFSTILATLLFIVQCGASVAAVNFGYGRPSDTLSQNQASQALKCFFLVQIFYKLTINCTKLSVLFLYLRIFTDRPWFIRTCWSLILFVLFACICFTTATLLQCSPVESAWNHWMVNRSCINLFALWYANAIYNILTDFMIVLMVPPVIYKLKLPMRQKLALTGVFGLGTIVCAASISRLTTLYSSAYGDDVTAGSLVSTIWTTIEAGLGVICANLPMLRTPLQHIFPRIFPSRSGSNRISSREMSLPCDESNSAPLVLDPRISPAPLIFPDEGSIAPSRQSAIGKFEIPNDDLQQYGQDYWRPCLHDPPPSAAYEMRLVHHGVHHVHNPSPHGQAIEEDWYKFQHRVW